MKVMSVERDQLNVALERGDLGDQGTNQDTNVTKASDVKDNEWYKSGTERGVLRVSNHRSFSVEWVAAIEERDVWQNLPSTAAVNTAHPFNQTARLKQTFWRPSPTTTTTGGGGGGFEPPALEIRQPMMHPSFQQAVNDDEERLYFKVGTEHGPTDPVIFNQAVSPIVIKAKPKKKKKCKKDRAPIFSAALKAATKLLFVKQPTKSVKVKIKASTGLNNNDKEGCLLSCDECEAVLPPLDMKHHHKRFHKEIECSDCFCVYVGDERLSRHICVPQDKNISKRPEVPKRSPVSPPDDYYQVISGDELVSSARPIEDDEEIESLKEIVNFPSPVSYPTTPTRSVQDITDFDLFGCFQEAFINCSDRDADLKSQGEEKIFIDVDDTTEVSTTSSQKEPDGLQIGQIYDDDDDDFVYNLPTP